MRKFLMNPSSFRISHTRTFSLELGMSTFSCSARRPLRMRVRRSATGSLFIGLPARLHDAGDLALERELAEAETAELELAEISARPSAQLAARIPARAEFRGTLRLCDQRRFRHGSLRLPERHAEMREERLGVLVRSRRRHDVDVHTAYLVDLVVDDLGEDQLLAQAHGVIATPVEALRRHALEVPHARQRDVRSEEHMSELQS